MGTCASNESLDRSDAAGWDSHGKDDVLDHKAQLGKGYASMHPDEVARDMQQGARAQQNGVYRGIANRYHDNELVVSGSSEHSRDDDTRMRSRKKKSLHANVVGSYASMHPDDIAADMASTPSYTNLREHTKKQVSFEKLDRPEQSGATNTAVSTRRPTAFPTSASSRQTSPPPAPQAREDARRQTGYRPAERAILTSTDSDDENNSDYIKQRTISIKKSMPDIDMDQATSDAVIEHASRDTQVSEHVRSRREKLKSARQKVYGQHIKLDDGYVPPRYPKSYDAVSFLDSALAENFMFSSLTTHDRRLLVDAFMMEDVEAGEIIIQQGAIGDYFYVLEKGSVKFVVDGTDVGDCTDGASFGELALLYNAPRAATCIATRDCRLWKVDQNTFRHILAQSSATQHRGIHDILRKVPFFSELDDAMLRKISDALIPVSFPQGERIISKHEAGEWFYIIREGNVKVHNIGMGESIIPDQMLGPGDFFGERALLTGEPRTAHVTAQTNVRTLCLSRETFEKVLGPLQHLIDEAMDKRDLLSTPFFANSNLDTVELNQLVELVTEVTFHKGEIIVDYGQPVRRNLYVIRSGKVIVMDEDGTRNILFQHDCLGEDWIESREGIVSHQRIIAEEETKCGVLTKQALEGVIGTTLERRKTLDHRPSKTKIDRAIKFNDIEKLRILGLGAFGKVWLVCHSTAEKKKKRGLFSSAKPSGTPYALKMIKKKAIIEHELTEALMREKEIMSSINHPFLVGLYATFQDERHLYMLMEIVQGGELFSLIHSGTRDGLPNDHAVFYGACVIEALSHLHSRYICYRDLKPENILIDKDGYAKLVDLGFAKRVEDKTYTFCGTPDYLAPEIILSKGHDAGVDYWAFGVLVFELLAGRTPFYIYGEDQIQLFKRIVKGKMNFPPEGKLRGIRVINGVAEDLIRKLLVKKQTERLGCLANGVKDIREHPWFGGMDYNRLVNKNMKAPWVPTIKDPFDGSNFDSYDDEEENERSLFASVALSEKEQELFKGFATNK